MQTRKYTPPKRDYLARVKHPSWIAPAFIKSLGRDGSFTLTYEPARARRFDLDGVNGNVRVRMESYSVEAVHIDGARV